ncbi:MAG: NAD(P)/FAD-dependent oxidoreductase [Spirochaetales bacterium]|nr:NAD(P)/FAD-dependent oxidoreductase [Spirochaetales bacterium]
MNKSFNILIIGGGYAGVKAAKTLWKRFCKNKSVTITLVDRNTSHTLMTELHEVATNRVELTSAKVSYKRIFSGTGLSVVHDEIVNLDFQKHIAQGLTGEYPWDRLLLATGGEPADFHIPGVKEHCFTLWSADDAVSIRRHLESMYRQAALEKDEFRRRELMAVVVAGGGFTGVELAGEMMEFLPQLCHENGLDPAEIAVINIEALGAILQILPVKQRSQAVHQLEKMGVQVKTNALVTEVTHESFHLKDGGELRAGTKIWTCGVQGKPIPQGEALEEGKAGRKLVNAHMRSPSFDHVYLAGDGIWFVEDGKPVPQTVEGAEQTAETAAHNIAHDIKIMQGQASGESKEFHGKYHGYMVSIGSRYAVSHTGGIAMAGFFSMALKHAVNVYYRFGLAGLNAAWEYIKHQFLEIRHRRSIFGGFLAWKAPGYWLLPLRLYVGVMWFLQGFSKIQQGWFQRNNDFVSVPVADGTASASTWENADAGTESLAADAWTAASEWAAEGGGEALLEAPLELYLWIARATVNHAPHFFQSGIVVFELLLGLALIGGAFTWLASAASFVFSLMLIMGAMTDASIFWYMAAALALMGGSGRILGLDYWLIPWLKRWWNGRRIAQKTYLYFGEPSPQKKKLSSERLEKNIS